MSREEWTLIIQRAIDNFGTPFYLFSSKPIAKRLELLNTRRDVKVANWLSFKTLPLRKLLRWWLNTGMGVEVASEFELLAALHEHFPPDKIMVNGVAKHFWKKECWHSGLRVNLDSISEVRCLAPIAREKRWRVGLRFHPKIQRDPENPSYPDQFGLDSEGLICAYKMLCEEDLDVETVHIHLRSNIPNLDYFKAALLDLKRALKKAHFQPICLDLGGGLPEEGVHELDSAWHSSFSLSDLYKLLSICRDCFQSVKEYVLENGRFMLSDCGVLVFSINDIKEIDGYRFLICDGGRINHALPSDWQDHEIGILPNRSGKLVKTAICGPTCMAYDCLARKTLHCDICIGDKIIWFNAGAYHLSWETRFSQPLARVLWHDDSDNIIEARASESFSDWWGQWR